MNTLKININPLHVLYIKKKRNNKHWFLYNRYFRTQILFKNRFICDSNNNFLSFYNNDQIIMINKTHKYLWLNIQLTYLKIFMINI